MVLGGIVSRGGATCAPKAPVVFRRDGANLDSTGNESSSCLQSRGQVLQVVALHERTLPPPVVQAHDGHRVPADVQARGFDV